MAYKIVVDAGHGGRDPGAVYQGRQEKDDNLKLALAVGDILQSDEIDVEYTRTTDVYNSPIEKARMGNNANADYFVSIHRKAAEAPNTESGIETLVYDNIGIKVKMAENINQKLEDLGFHNYKVTEKPNLVVLRRTAMPSILVEIGFIDSDDDNAKFDAKFDQIANAIAAGILETINQSIPMAANITPETVSKQIPIEVLYRVQVGAFKNAEYAERMVIQLQSQGFPAFMIYGNGFYRVQVGAFKILDNAVRMECKLRQAGYDTFITTK